MNSLIAEGYRSVKGSGQPVYCATARNCCRAPSLLLLWIEAAPNTFIAAWG